MNTAVNVLNQMLTQPISNYLSRYTDQGCYSQCLEERYAHPMKIENSRGNTQHCKHSDSSRNQDRDEQMTIT